VTSLQNCERKPPVEPNATQFFTPSRYRLRTLLPGQFSIPWVLALMTFAGVAFAIVRLFEDVIWGTMVLLFLWFGFCTWMTRWSDPQQAGSPGDKIVTRQLQRLGLPIRGCPGPQCSLCGVAMAEPV
jgi:hypothetical protein